jgi:hypothetical protein
MTKDIPIYKITIDPEYSDGEELGMSFDEHKKLFFSDDLKYRVVAPAMIPMEIYRNDEENDEYYVSFSVEAIEQIHSKFMKDLSNRNVFNLEHDTDKTVPAYVLEAWIVEDPKKDKAYSSYGIEVPKGTLMVTAQVTDKEYYNELVKNEQIGFSIEGFLGLKLSNQLNNKYSMKLPDGEHLIEGKIYVVVDGEIIEIKDAPVVEEEAMTEEIALETVVEEEVIEETPATEEMAIDPAADAEAILAIVQPVIDEQINAIIAMIADLRNHMEEVMSEGEEVVEVEATKLSQHDKFSMVSKFLKNNN